MTKASAAACTVQTSNSRRDTNACADDETFVESVPSLGAPGVSASHSVLGELADLCWRSERSVYTDLNGCLTVSIVILTDFLSQDQ